MINIVTALACEANPIIQHYRLKKSPQARGFALYTNEAINLIISGVGPFAAASAVGYLQALLSSGVNPVFADNQSHVWLNVGIAGHRSMDLGTALLAHKVSDVAAVKRFYPCFTFDLPCASAAVISVPMPETAYESDAAYDMEAVGFCAAATRLASTELVHCLKIISDNHYHPHQYVTRQVGEDLVGNQLLVIESLVHEFTALLLAMPDVQGVAQDYCDLTAHLRFTVAQQNQLKRLLRRWRTLKKAPVGEHLAMTEYKDAKTLLQAMETALQSIVFRC